MPGEPAKQRKVKAPIYILGSGGFAREVHHLIRRIGMHEVAAFVDIHSKPSVQAGKLTVPVIPENELPTYCNLAIGVGDPRLIAKFAERFSGFTFPNLIDPDASGDWPNITLGRGNIICAGVRLTTDIKLGSFNVFNLNCTVGHDTTADDCNVFNPGANISGGCRLGRNIMIGTNAAILQYLEIGDGAVVGAGSLVNKNVPAGLTVAGVPAKPLHRDGTGLQK